MDSSEWFPSKYVGHADLRGQDVVVVMRLVQGEKIGDDQEWVLYFQGMTKALILKKTNVRRIAALYGPETNNWIGRPITLYAAETEFGGKPCKGIRVREEMPAPAAAPAAALLPIVVPTAPVVAAPAAVLPPVVPAPAVAQPPPVPAAAGVTF